MQFNKGCQGLLEGIPEVGGGVVGVSVYFLILNYFVYLHFEIVNQMQYNPDISVSENARNNNVSEAAVRKYIKVHKIDRRHDEKAKKYALIQKLREEHPEWSARAIAKELSIAPATVCSYINGTDTNTIEGKWSARSAKDSITFDSSTPIDYLRMETYDGSKIDLVAFSNGQFRYKGYSIGFGNMRNFPINFFGETFLSAETAYIACCYGLNNPDCIRIQREIQKYENALTCKKEYRNRGKKVNKTEEQYGRKDFHLSIWHFNLMLYLVWLKCKTHPDFCRDLLAVPDSTALIENQNEVPTNGIGDWGCLNPDAKKAKRKMSNELQGKGISEFKANETAAINTWNIGTWVGMNHCGKILMACRTALRNGTEPFIDYQALNDAKIYLFGKLLIFSRIETAATKRIDNQLFERFTKDELLDICTYHREDMIKPFDFNSIFSNFYPFNFTVNGKTFHSTEQYYHWKRFEGYPEYQEDLLSFTSPRNAWDCYYYVRGRKKPKVRLGKSVVDAIEKDYEKRFEYMREALRYKLEYCKGFKEALLETGEKVIAEKDQTRRKKEIWAVHKRTGANVLGKLLMELRSEITHSPIEKYPNTIKNDERTTITDTKNRLLGAIIGDMAGSIYEQAKKNVYEYDKAVLFPDNGKNNKITDDSVMTIAVAHYLLNNEYLTLEGLTRVVHQYTLDYPLTVKLNWNRGETSMYGEGFQKWIEFPEPYQGDCDGSAMRVSSVGWLCDSIEQVMDVAKFTADISHNSKEGERGAQAIALCVFLARTGKTKKEIKDAVQKLILYNLNKSCDTIRKETMEYVKRHNHISAKSIDAVPAAIQAFLESKDYEDAIRLAISMGGDSDTIACMCGAIAVAYYKDIPSWLIKIANNKLSKTYKAFNEIVKRVDEATPRHYTIS